MSKTPRLRTLPSRLRPLNMSIAQPMPKQVDPFYVSPEWRALMAEIIAERGRRCEDPDCTTPHGAAMKIHGDHEIERADGGAPLDKANIKLRCQGCHNRVTAQRRAARMARPT